MIPLGTVRKLNLVSDEAPMNRNKRRRIRIAAFNNQRGFCCYCDLPMWEEDPAQFATKYQLTLKQTRQLRSTAEHLLPLFDGGDDSPSNIAAACCQCNRLRHRRKRVKSPAAWRPICIRRVVRIYQIERFNCSQGYPRVWDRTVIISVHQKYV